MLARRHPLTRIQTATILLIVTVSIIAVTLASPASAHEGRAVGDYNFVVGLLREPAYEGQLNAVSLVITRATHTEEGDNASEMDADASADDDDHHDSDSHDHSHDHSHDDTESGATAVTDEAGILTHGAVFMSNGIGLGEAFELKITEDLRGIGIPYHVHPGDHQGVIIVSDEASDQTVDKSVTITKDALEPRRINVNAGDTVAWVNRELQNTVVMSGPLSSMTPEMKSSIEAGSTSGTSQSESVANRVTGISETLKVELTHTSTSSTREMSLTELADDPGHYVAEFVPTAPGDYRMRFFGSIEGNAIDETFDSGPDTFDTVIPSDAIQFPVVLESNREIQNATRGALDAVQDLETDLEATSSNASTGMIIGIIGIVFGFIATGISVFAITIARRRN